MNANPQATVEITAANHKHKGQPVAKGERIQTDEATAQWLVDHKRGIRVADAGAKKEGGK